MDEPPIFVANARLAYVTLALLTQRANKVDITLTKRAVRLQIYRWQPVSTFGHLNDLAAANCVNGSNVLTCWCTVVDVEPWCAVTLVHGASQQGYTNAMHATSSRASCLRFFLRQIHPLVQGDVARIS